MAQLLDREALDKPQGRGEREKAVKILAKSIYRQLRAIQHGAVIVAGSPRQESFQISLDTAFKHRPAVCNHFDGFVEVELIGRQKKRERLDIPRLRFDRVFVMDKIHATRTARSLKKPQQGAFRSGPRIRILDQVQIR